MRLIVFCILFSLLVFSADGKEVVYTASTPAGPVVRTFLGIPLGDSVDFIRWKLTLLDNRYVLNCRYGISKPNTNGFINDGNTVEIRGELKKEGNYYRLKNGHRILRIAGLNSNLLHLLNAENKLLVGNSGWSYTLNTNAPTLTNKVSITAKQNHVEDSMVFEGRTPCGVPGIIAPGVLCYKLKWHIVLYGNKAINEPGTYKAFGTPYRKEGGKKGNWKIMTLANNSVIYQLDDDSGNGFLYLLKVDEHILLFTDARGKLLVGDEDFSYTLNRCG